MQHGSWTLRPESGAACGHPGYISAAGVFDGGCAAG